MKSKLVRPFAIGILLLTLATAGAFYFYYYNYLLHTPGQARALRLPGLREFVCKGTPYVAGETDQCGKRSMYGDADWGVTAYTTIYGIESAEEAKAIAQFMVNARKQNKQEHIPMNVKMYTSPRSEGPTPHKHKIFDETL